MTSVEQLRLVDAVPPSNRLGPRELKDMLELMLRIRRFEVRTRELFLEQVIKGTAHSSVGQEGIAAGVGRALEAGDYIATHHRGHGHVLAKGADVRRMMAELMGRKTGYCYGLGGSMHIADFERGIFGANGIVGAGMGLGSGAALAAKLAGKGQVAVALFGDGGSNEGIFHEAMNLAAVWKLPLIFVCENNQYGLSTPTSMVLAGGSVARRAAGYNVPGQRIDGNDAVAVHDAVHRAAMRARAGEGPTLIEAMTYRWGDHSMRANLPGYRSDKELADWQTADPIERLRNRLKDGRVMDDAEYDRMVRAVEAEIEAAIEWSKSQPEPDLETALTKVYTTGTGIGADVEPAPGTRKITYREGLNEAMNQEMARDHRVIIMGEDVARVGGIFGATRGLLERFGPERVRDTPITEAGFSGCGVGAAMAGLRPIVEIQIFDFVTHMMDNIVNQAAKARFMLGGAAKVPIVFRGPQGGGVRLAAQHSQSLESWFTNVPGLQVYAPSNPYDAKGLLTTAIRSDDPVVFLEHKMLYLGGESPVPEEPYAIKPGRARIVRPGEHCTVVAYLAMVANAEQAAIQLARKGIEIEIIDPRTLKPFDIETVVASIKRTGRCVVVHEAARFGGFGAEIAAEIMEEAFDYLDAPVVRLGAMEMPVPYNDQLERSFMPSAKDIQTAVEKVCYRG